VYEITLPMAYEHLASRGRASLFGKPEVLEQFNAVARKVAQENGCDYLDVYEPTRTYPEKPVLFTADGVHLSAEGNRLIALELLKHLGKPQ
jgi:lysophospholipase L1-like esterase